MHRTVTSKSYCSFLPLGGYELKFIDEKYFKYEDENIIFTGPYMQAYIPSFYFEHNLSYELGDNISTLGLFNFKTFNDPEGQDANPIRLFNIPTTIITCPSKHSVVELDLYNSGEKEVYVLLEYFANDVFCPRNVPKDIKAFKSFLAVLIQGKIPKSISYDDIISIWEKNQMLGDIKLGVSDTVQEAFIAKIYRNKENRLETFGAVLGRDPKHSPYDYITASPREITKLESTFTGISFENMDEVLTSAVVGGKENREENISPMEEILTY